MDCLMLAVFGSVCPNYCHEFKHVLPIYAVSFLFLSSTSVSLEMIFSSFSGITASVCSIRFQAQRYFRVLNAAARSSPTGLSKNLPLSLLLLFGRAYLFAKTLHG
jgi:hypothetical protein